MALNGIGPESRSAFAHNPFGALPHLGFTARPVAALGDGVRSNGSSCHGMSFLDGGVIMYAPSPHSRRENFTVAHEVGHFLVAKQEDILDWLGDLSDPKRALETVCDRIASELLLPRMLIDQVTGGQAPLAEHVIALFEASN
ncbi:MAG: ImmA/IrrE family metallo-endopeptidase, partial [Promicromonosporaceae bacterium]|nr:ImmA/IrrE family metallo-endopeptidase [Promicromonosporaceae bacterium]